MSALPFVLRHPVAVIPSDKAAEQLARAGIYDPAVLVDQLGRLATAGALPARMEVERDRLVVYSQRWKVGFYLSGRERAALKLADVSPLSFKDQEQLLKGALLLRCAPGWHTFPHVRDVGSPYRVPWAELCHTWERLGVTGSAVPALPAHHGGFLDLLTEVIEAVRDIEIAKQQEDLALPYRRVDSAREERRSARGVYVFHLLRPCALAQGALVYVTDQPDLRGRVLRVRDRDREVTVRFDGVVDFARLPQQGALGVLPGDRVHRARLAAVQTLRDREATNPHLLTHLVDRQLAPYRPDVTAQPRATLDGDQLRAFQSALTVPDLLLVLGPPGTGKTTTITEMVAVSAARHQRVLVTSHTNRAVDNVLERLPAYVRAVRVGNEDAMTAHARGLMVEVQVETLRREILATTEGSMSRLTPFTAADDAAGRWMSFLTTQLGEAQLADTEVQALSAELTAAMDRAVRPLATQLATAEQEHRTTRAELEQLGEREHGARQRLAEVRRRAAGGPLAFLFRWQQGWRERRLSTVREQLAVAVREAGRAEQAYAEIRAQADAIAAADPEVGSRAAARDAAAEARDKFLTEVTRAAEMVRATLRPVVPVSTGTPVDLPGWMALHQKLTAALALARSRARLLDQWRAEVTEAEQDLHRELLRYADVVAATCIGTATTALLAGLDFDLAIVDEAGQISTPDLLVPLVRARRAVLVGDHHQLPPFLDHEVASWADSLPSGTAPSNAGQIRDLLRRSAFERLYQGVGDANRVMLTVQRRMPEVLARFVSTSFYGGVLRTEHRAGRRDPLFHSPMAMIDTSDRPARERAERTPPAVDAFEQGGYLNELEARLIVRLLTRHADHYGSWAVIVPFRAQVKLLAELLTKELGANAVAENVGTVDSFQGGERDLIVYGFTRSNQHGNIGFLKELRRLNVAITRARRQIVLVGDTTTLTNARDPGFAALANSLVVHLGAFGERRPSREIEEKLNG
ncbi:AAA domain-containing protein [Micromonospora sp. WMMD987]|uniref:DEAD/DEAH box helicase n=1 Tax=Micromonospora sp. WMMD987 TaxID=3016089 RepID=UPI00249CDB2E|nr:AAA domain-containing protein [Micromonospora sp. WMMD987]WFE96498.1 AAA domain-containing protein [Micromonospora sp. WMMD987]